MDDLEMLSPSRQTYQSDGLSRVHGEGHVFENLLPEKQKTLIKRLKNRLKQLQPECEVELEADPSV